MVVGTEGDCGDIIYLLGILSQLPGPHALLIQKSEVTSLRTHEAVERIHRILRPLVSKQSYIADFRPEIGVEGVDWKSGEFRNAGFHYMGFSLLTSHLNYLIQSKGIGRGIDGGKKWLTVEPSKESPGRVLVNRTSRYQNPFFQWGEVVRHYGDRIMFVGHQGEHQAFCGAYGNVEYRPTENFLELAELIAGGDLFIGNQSSPNAVAEGLKQTLIQESSLTIPDCIFRRLNAQHVSDGACYLPHVSGSGEMWIPSTVKLKMTRRSNMPPPNGWVFPGFKKNMGISSLVESIFKFEKKIRSKSEIKEAIIDHNIATNPEFFRDRSFDRIFDAFNEAVLNSSHA